ncbi:MULTISPECIES: DUF3991 and toprim domain-containing protein [Rhizobium]|uniref:DUF3991 domain-containing protein n=6 Tax=Rhizobium TaxID=379 RepID=A0A7W8XV70_9HYPH|nr:MULTISPECIES: DUF3991 and toprim domain-containing protein [Rhizobium]MBB6494916.1 hypothetical protein [Rhizobium tropici]MBB4569927.1 hypothetical protein [Rhizobium leucaenae]MBB5576166.1 hypothetical protein [Rhizobium paranaense]MBB6305242.1 hypothetical protein [Rhizobium leucaenae]MDK4743402.1 DUF3991 and toprim domain-containing protein [Rhizobium sp. CNPSo 3464]
MNRTDEQEAIAFAIGRKMERREIESLRDKVSCAAVLDKNGFAIDVKESTRRAVKYRRGSEIIIVTHGGRGWFDPLSDAKGDIFGLVEHLDRVGFSACVAKVADLIGFHISKAEWQPGIPDGQSDLPLGDRWQARRRPWRGSSTWRYLQDVRCLPTVLLCSAIKRNLLREGPQGTMWAAHTNEAGGVTGWEARGPQYRGFASGGTKVLFRLGSRAAVRLAVTEAAIDAMSLAAIEGLRDGTLYLSTGGGWSPTTAAALRRLASGPNVQLVAATDANPQGEMFAERLRALAEEAGCDWMRLRPSQEDWNEVQKLRPKRGSEKQKLEEEAKEEEACRRRAGRVKGGFSRLKPALDAGGRDAGGRKRITKD